MSDLAKVETAIEARTDRAAFEPRSFEEVRALSQALVKSGLMPYGLDTPEKVAVAIIMGRELGFSVMQSTRLIHVIEGRPTLSSAAIVGLVKASPACEYFQCVETTDKIATYETLRKGAKQPVRFSYTHEQAKQAGLMNPSKNGKPSNHVKHPAAMLRARCETALARSEYPDVVGGLYDPDELIERAEPRDVTPPPVTSRRSGAVVEAPAPVVSPADDALRTCSVCGARAHPRDIAIGDKGGVCRDCAREAQGAMDHEDAPAHDAETGEVEGSAEEALLAEVAAAETTDAVTAIAKRPGVTPAVRDACVVRFRALRDAARSAA